jgi:hypothetical protein
MSKMVHDLDKRAAARDSLFAMQALSSGLRLATSSNLDRRLFAADKIQDPDKRQKTTQTLLNMPAANTPTSELSTAAQSECPLRSAAAQKALRDRAARRTKERDDVVNGTHMCLRPANAEHLDNHLTDLYTLVTDNRRPVFGSVSKLSPGHNGKLGQYIKHPCLGMPRAISGQITRTSELTRGRIDASSSCLVDFREGKYHPTDQHDRNVKRLAYPLRCRGY